jgi:hypothetical protein
MDDWRQQAFAFRNGFARGRIGEQAFTRKYAHKVSPANADAMELRACGIFTSERFLINSRLLSKFRRANVRLPFLTGA